jgi:hypothetical protein
MNLDSKAAQHLVDEIARAATPEDAMIRCGRAWDFLLAQFYVLCGRANGYPRNPIDGHTWFEGRALAEVCDRFVDAAAQQGNRAGEEQAAGLATAIACQVLSHYPEQIFPRVLRVARCKEANGNGEKAVSDYAAVVLDFGQLDLGFMLEEEGAAENDVRTILAALIEAIEGLERLDPAALSQECRAWKAKAVARCGAER